MLLILMLVLCASAIVDGGDKSCGKAAKAETYLETAAELIDKLRDNIQEGSGDCSCPEQPMDCDEVLKCGMNKSGVYQIWPRNRIMSGGIAVFCDMESDSGGWTVIQRRGDYKRPHDFFSKSWHEYKTGFGDLRRDFWLGNDNIYAITNQRKYYLWIDMQDRENNTRYAFYDRFWIENEGQNYKLHVYDYSGDAGDSFSRYHNHNGFSTMDRDNDNSSDHCAQQFSGGWWYANCLHSNLNGLYPARPEDSRFKGASGILWSSWKVMNESLTASIIRIRPSDFQSNFLDLNVEPK